VSRGERGEPGPADDGPWLEAAQAAPGLLLFVDEATDAAELEAALAAGTVAAVVAGTAAVPRWRGLAARYRVALLAQGEPVGEVDGVHLADATQVAPLRLRLGKTAIVGAACRLSRHEAMVAGEAGADYVMFGAIDRLPTPGDELFELVGWWRQLFVLPCAAAGSLDPEIARALLDAGADLLATGRVSGEIARSLRSVALSPPS
jgi:thiamine-phosphate pyrophosphorylase